MSESVAIVTGASKGIGLATARTLAAAGFRVALIARTFETSLAQEKNFLLVPADLSHADSASSAVDKVLSVWGRVDCLVNNCGGLPKSGQFMDLSDGDWMDSYNLNFMSAIRMTRAVLPSMEKSRHGKIVLVSSITGIQPGDFNPHYSTMKTALLALNKNLSATYAPKGINVNCVTPGNIETSGWDEYIQSKAQQSGEDLARVAELENERVRKTIPMGRQGQATEVADLIHYLCSDSSNYITGANFVIDGGKYRSI